MRFFLRLQLFLICSCTKNNLLINTKKILHIQTVKDTDFVIIIGAFLSRGFFLGVYGGREGGGGFCPRPDIDVKEMLVRKGIDVSEHERLSSITLSHKS